MFSLQTSSSFPGGPNLCPTCQELRQGKGEGSLCFKYLQSNRDEHRRQGRTNQCRHQTCFSRLDFSEGKGGRTQDLDRYLTSTVVPLELTGFHSWAIPLLKSPWWGRKTSQQGQGAALTFLSRIVQKTGRNRVVLAMGTRVPQVTWRRGTALADGSGDKYLPATGEGSKTKARDASSLVRLLLRAWEKIFFQAVAVDF